MFLSHIQFIVTLIVCCCQWRRRVFRPSGWTEAGSPQAERAEQQPPADRRSVWGRKPAALFGDHWAEDKAGQVKDLLQSLCDCTVNITQLSTQYIIQLLEAIIHLEVACCCHFISEAFSFWCVQCSAVYKEKPIAHRGTGGDPSSF